jgi:ABC-type glycerol-3-phosphate transport system substrate-binding protein
MRTSFFGLQLRTWIGIALAFVVLAFTGDRLALSRPSSHRLKFAHTFTTDSERAILEAAIAEFRISHPDVEIEQIVSNSEIYNTVGWRLQFQGRNQPDIYFHWQGFKVERCIDNGWAMDLTPFLSKGFIDQFVPSSIRHQRSGIYFLPHSVDIGNLVWYNRMIFTERRLSAPRRLEDWLTLCVSLRNQNILPLAQGNRDLWPMGNLGAEFLGQTLGFEASSGLFEPGQPITAADLRGLNTFTFLVEHHCLDLPGVLDPGGVGSLGDIDAKVLFLSGKAGQHILGSWFLADIEDARSRNELKFDVEVFAVPPGAGEIDAMTAVSTGYLVNPRTRNPKAAVEFLELILSRKYQSEFARLGSLSMRRDAEEFTTAPLAKRMLAILGTAAALVPPPDTGYRPEQAAAFYEVCGKILTSKLNLEQAATAWTAEKQGLAKKGL